jgi:hypothetical protein
MKNDEVARRIIDYLSKHPDAGDTLEGIAKWWLGLERIDESVEDVSKVIEDLIKSGLIKKEDLRGRKAYYKISKID